MVTLLRRFCLCFFLVLALVALAPIHGSAAWIQPTPDELKMTSDPKAPDAEAVYLNREEIVEDKEHFHRVYARIKILTEKGKDDYSDIELPYEAGVANIRAIEGRTIHSDGTVIPFTGKPYTKELIKSGGTKIMAKVFSMPDVQVGSIVEYRWELQYDDQYYMPPTWVVQQPLYVHQSHYHFVPVNMGIFPISITDAMGKTVPAQRLLYYHSLPPGVAVREGLDGFDLVANDIAALPDEPLSPPMGSFSYRVVFYYAASSGSEEYWKTEGRIWSKDVDRFASPSDKIRQAVAQIVAPGDTDLQKLQKIYTAVMQIDNTRFSREHSAAENKAAGLRVRTADDIWEQKRGSDDEIDRLFIAMARAAGFTAYDMKITERDRRLLNTGILDWDQLEDEIAIVNIGGKEQFFDPGQRYCEFGKLHWMHTEVQGIRQTDHGPDLALTPPATYTQNTIHRVADLQLGPDGSIKGVARITMTGQAALHWRQRALRTDEEAIKKQFADEIQEHLPPGARVHLNHFLGLTDPTLALMAVLDVSGSMGTETGKHVFLPATFFEAGRKPVFTEEKRESPIDMHYPYIHKDEVDLTLPPGLSMQSVPDNAQVPFLPNGIYQAKYTSSANSLHEVRVEAVSNPVYHSTEYPQLRGFFQKINAQDQQQVVLRLAPAADTTTSSAGSGGGL